MEQSEEGKEKTKGQWKEGQSGNPAGRPKGSGKVPTQEEMLEELAKCNTKALKKTMAIMSRGTENNQLKAAFKVMDTYYNYTAKKQGKDIVIEKTPTSTVGGRDDINPDHVETTAKVIPMPTQGNG